MSKEDLIDFAHRPKEEVRMLQSRGGSVCSVNKKNAARLRELRKKGVSDPISLELIKLLDDPSYASLDILKFIKELQAKPMTPKSQIDFIHAYLGWYKSQFGDKKLQTMLNIRLSSKTVSLKDIQLLMREGRTDLDEDEPEAKPARFDEDDEIVEAEIVEKESKEDVRTD